MASIIAAWIYLPVIAGIITPMLWLLAAWYIAWHINGFIFPFRPIWGGLWLPDYWLIVSIWIVEAVVFLVGSFLFCQSLFVMVRDRLKGVLLSTTGPYRWIRHPQHLGIILFLLPLALVNLSYFPYWSGIRPGDILSWSLVTFMLIVVADIEEIGLARRLGQEYEDYREKTHFLLPGISFLNLDGKLHFLKRGKPLRYILWFVFYWSIMSTVLYLFTFVELKWMLFFQELSQLPVL